MNLYRLYTENKNRGELEALLATYFDGFTLIEATGYWKGQRENGLIVEVLTDSESMVYDAAETIRLLNDQEAVLVLSSPVRSKLIQAV